MKKARTPGRYGLSSFYSFMSFMSFMVIAFYLQV